MFCVCFSPPFQYFFINKTQCRKCNQFMARTGVQLKCFNCKKVYHNKFECSSMNAHTVRNILNINYDRLCNSCAIDSFPFAEVETTDLIDIFSVNVQDHQPKPGKKTKCNHCMKKVKQNVSFVFCKSCSHFFHLKC